MTLVKDPIGRARKVKSEQMAARLRDELEPELALNDDLDPVWEHNAEEALSELRERYPDIDSWEYGTAHSQTTRGMPKRSGNAPGLSRGAARGLTELTGDEHERRDQEASKRGGPEPHERRERRKRVTRGLRAPDWRNPPIPEVAGTATFAELVIYTVSGVLGLVLLYRLTTGTGPTAVEQGVRSTTNFVRAFTSPVDPLRPNHTTARRTP